MNESMKIRIAHFVLDCTDPSLLADFYANLLGWDDKRDLGPEWSVVSKPSVSPLLLFQKDTEYEPPVWPNEAETQCQMAHIDFAVDDIERAIRHAVNCGAKIADKQYSDKWTVMIDPAGHPFCFVRNPSLVESVVKNV